MEAADDLLPSLAPPSPAVDPMPRRHQQPPSSLLLLRRRRDKSWTERRSIWLHGPTRYDVLWRLGLWLGARGKLSREEIERAGGGVKYRENTDGKRRHARKDAPFWPPFAKHPFLPSEDRVVLEGLFYGFGKI
jgi:hypothetical protein